MRVLLTNDDGIHAPGLWELVEAFRPFHQVNVVAPDRERSAVGHGITLHQPLRYKKISETSEIKAFSVNGMPADCVKLALAKILDEVPELIVSGINPGANVGVNINYSGTVAAAKEAALSGIPAMAVSVIAPGKKRYGDVARFAESLTGHLVAMALPEGTFLNVNFPDLPVEQIRGVRWCKQGNGHIIQRFQERRDPRNLRYFWQGVDDQRAYDAADIDGSALAQRYVSVTPIRCDMTDYDTLQRLSGSEIPVTMQREDDG